MSHTTIALPQATTVLYFVDKRKYTPYLFMIVPLYLLKEHTSVERERSQRRSNQSQAQGIHQRPNGSGKTPRANPSTTTIHGEIHRKRHARLRHLARAEEQRESSKSTRSRRRDYALGAAVVSAANCQGGAASGGCQVSRFLRVHRSVCQLPSNFTY